MSKTYIVGDIHGCYYTLLDVLKIIKETKEEDDTLIFLGDYFDRGNFNAEVYYLLRKLQEEYKENIILLRGNHEQMQLEAIRQREKECLWFSNGGYRTAEDFTEAQISSFNVEKWIKTMPYAYYDKDLDIYCVHSYLPHRAIEDFDKDELKDCIWKREKSEVGKKVFHGHTPHKGIIFQNNDINLDTGCVFGGGLTFATIGKNCMSIITIPTNEKDKVNLI